jgi:hypothetical protein
MAADNTYDILDENAEDAIRSLLVGRRIVSAEMGEYDIRVNQWGPRATGRLVLDNGIEVFAIPNRDMT